MGKNLVPGHRIACPVRAEHRAGRIPKISLRIIRSFQDHILRIMAGLIALQQTGQPSLSVRICRHLRLIASHADHRRCSRDHCCVAKLVRCLKGSVHSLEICQCPAHILRGDFQAELIHRLQQNTFCLHQPLAYCPVRSLAEIASLRMLHMGASRHQCQLHIGQLRSHQNAAVLFLLQMSQNQPLPVLSQDLFPAV